MCLYVLVQQSVDIHYYIFVFFICVPLSEHLAHC